MIEEFAEVSRFCRIEVPAAHRRPIAVVGAGAIVDVAHLVAYRQAGLDVRGITDLNADRAHAVAERHGVPRVYADLEEVLADETVEVVDVAVRSDAQPAIAAAVLGSGRHLLAQKPFAPDLATGEQICAQAERYGRQIAVNQQLRFDEGIAATKKMLDLGWIGRPTALRMTIDIRTEWDSWPWMAESPQLEIRYHSIHYLDTIRWLLGEPRRVYCVGGRTPGQRAVGETRTFTTLTFDGDLHALVAANHENDCGDGVAEFRLDGTHGSIKGTLGLLYDYPHGRPDTLHLHSTVLPTDGWVPYPVTSRWVPDAFLGPMASLLDAVATDSTPRSSGRDNLGTLALVEALYRAMDSGESQRLGAVPTGAPR